MNVVEYNGVAYYANREVTPVYSSGNTDNDSTSSWPYTTVQSGVEFSAGIAGTPVTAGASLGISAVGIGQIGYGSAVTGMAGFNLLDDMQTLFAKRNKGSQATEALTTKTKPLIRAQEFEKSLVHLSASERVGVIRIKLREIAKGNGGKVTSKI